MDPALNSVDELMNFFRTWNLAPDILINCHGHHTETRTRTVSDGNGGTRTETYTVEVTDFRYDIPLSHLVLPFGFIQVTEEAVEHAKAAPWMADLVSDFQNAPVDLVCESYLRSPHEKRALKMKKTVDWDWADLKSRIHGAIRESYGNTIDGPSPPASAPKRDALPTPYTRFDRSDCREEK